MSALRWRACKNMFGGLKRDQTGLLPPILPAKFTGARASRSVFVPCDFVLQLNPCFPQTVERDGKNLTLTTLWLPFVEWCTLALPALNDIVGACFSIERVGAQSHVSRRPFQGGAERWQHVDSVLFRRRGASAQLRFRQRQRS